MGAEEHTSAIQFVSCWPDAFMKIVKPCIQIYLRNSTHFSIHDWVSKWWENSYNFADEAEFVTIWTSIPELPTPDLLTQVKLLAIYTDILQSKKGMMSKQSILHKYSCCKNPLFDTYVRTYGISDCVRLRSNSSSNLKKIILLKAVTPACAF